MEGKFEEDKINLNEYFSIEISVMTLRKANMKELLTSPTYTVLKSEVEH